MHRARNLIGLCLTLTLLLTACAGSKPAAAPAAPPQPGSPAQSTPAPQPKVIKKLRLANAVTPPNMIHIPMYIAMDQGFFKEEGLEAEIVNLESGVSTVRALISNSVDVAATSADPILAAAAQNGGVIGVWTYAPLVTNAMISAKDIKTPADLKGKVMGIGDKGAFVDVLTRVVLAKNGIKESEVNFVVTSTAGRLQALLEGRTNTAILHIEQVYTALEKNPDLNYLVKLWESDPQWWYSAYAVNKEMLKKDPDLVKRFLRAMVKTTRWMYKPENKDKVIETYIKNNKGFTKEIAAKAYDDIVKGKQWPVNEGVSRAIVDHTVSEQIKFGILQTDKKISYEDVYDRTLIDEVLKELGRQGDGL